MSPQTAEALDRDGFTPAEQAYFASQGQNTDGLVEDAPDATVADPVIPDPAIDNGVAVADVAAVVPDPNADPFDDLEKSAKPTRDKTGRVIPEANFRVVSEKYKATKTELVDLKKRFEALETDAKSAREETAKEKEIRIGLNERLKIFHEVIAPQAGAEAKPEKPVRPNPEEDIFGYVKWLEDTHASELAELKGQIGQTAQTVHDTTAETQLRDTYQADAQRFMGETPDFAAAYQFVNRVRDANLQRLGYKDQNHRAQIRMDEERGLVAQAIKDRLSPAEIIYGMAQDWGYVKAAPVAAAAATTPAAATPAAAASAAPSVTEEVERIAKAQAASKSLSSGGGASVGPMTVETLANMTEGEFEAYARKNPNVVKELMGG